MYVVYMHTMVPKELEILDECLSRINAVRQRPAWRRRVLADLKFVKSLSELRVLRAVERRTTANASPSVRDVAEEMGIEHSTASRAVANTVEVGFLVKSNDSDDQRRCVLTFTDQGRQALVEATERRREVVAESASSWTLTEIESLTSLLTRLVHDFEARL